MKVSWRVSRIWFSYFWTLTGTMWWLCKKLSPQVCCLRVEILVTPHKYWPHPLAKSGHLLMMISSEHGPWGSEESWPWVLPSLHYHWVSQSGLSLEEERLRKMLERIMHLQCKERKYSMRTADTPGSSHIDIYWINIDIAAAHKSHNQAGSYLWQALYQQA